METGNEVAAGIVGRVVPGTGTKMTGTTTTWIEHQRQAANRRIESMSQRSFFRCAGCLSVVAIEGGWEPDTKCGACDSTSWLFMGFVNGSRLVTLSERSVCDPSCTNARGPDCECACFGANHGSKLVVTIRRDVGAVPVVTPKNPEKARAQADEFRAAIATFRAAVEANTTWTALREKKNKRVWLTSSEFSQWLTFSRAFNSEGKIKAMTSQAGRMKAIARVTAVFAPAVQG